MKLHRFFFLLLILFLPTQLGLHLWPSWALVFGIRVDYLSPTLYLIDILVALLLLAWRPKKLPSLFFVLIFFALANSLLGLIPLLSFYKWCRVLLYLGVGVYTAVNRKWVRQNISQPLAIALVYTIIIGVAQVITSQSIGGPLYFLGERSFDRSTIGIALMRIGSSVLLRPYATLPHPNAFAGFLLVGLILLYWAKPRLKFLSHITILVIGAVLLSFSQAAWVALGTTALFAILPIRALKHTLFILLIMSGILSLILPIFAQQISLSDIVFPLTLAERIQLAEQAGVVISRSPILGAGLGAFIPAMHSTMRSIAPLFQPVHNLWLLIFAELGLVGVIGSLVLALHIHTKNRPLLLILGIIIITGFVDHYWITLPQTFLLFLISAALWYNNPSDE